MTIEPRALKKNMKGSNAVTMVRRIIARPCRNNHATQQVGTIMDIVSPDQRSRMMSRIRGKSTKPEMAVRQTAHRLGYRFRLHQRGLPGSPDLVFPRLKLAMFVNGCFWHRHENCKHNYHPKTNIEFWTGKFKNNVLRDKKVKKELEELGWRVVVIWECETADAIALRRSLSAILTA